MSRDEVRNLFTVLLVVVVGGVTALVLISQENKTAKAPARVLQVTAVAGTTNTQLLAVEARLTGVDPQARGRLPDVKAFRRAGIASIRIDGTTMTVSFLPTATTAQVERARAVLQSDPAIAGVVESKH